MVMLVERRSMLKLKSNMPGKEVRMFQLAQKRKAFLVDVVEVQSGIMVFWYYFSRFLGWV